MKKSLSYIVLVLIFISLLSCSSSDNEKDFILKTGKYKIETDEYEFLRKDNSKLSTKELNNKLLEEAYILAYALDNDFDTIINLNNKLEHAKRYYSSRVGGYVWNRKVKPKLKVGQDDINTAYQNRKFSYRIELIHFPSEKHFHQFGDNIGSMNSEAGFNYIKDRIVDGSEVGFKTQTLKYPFYPLGIYKDLLKIKEGEILGPFETLNGYYILRMDSVKRSKEKINVTNTNNIRNELLKTIRDRHIWKSQKDILKKANWKTNNGNIEDFVAHNGLELQESKKYEKKILMEYDYEGERIFYSIQDFKEFLNHAPVISGYLTRFSDVKGMLRNIVIDIYLFKEAQSMGIEKDDHYLVWEKIYRDQLFVKYFKQQIGSKIAVNEFEIFDYYTDNKQNFISFEFANLELYKFEDISSALKNRPSVKNNEIDQFDRERLTFKMKEISRGENDNSDQIKILETVIPLKTNELSEPVQIGNNFFLIRVISKNGVEVLPYNFVRDDIKETLYKNKMERNYADNIETLKRRYSSQSIF